MFPTGNDLPLFSGTAQRAHAPAFKPSSQRQPALFVACPLCFGSGSVKIKKNKIVTCPCQNKYTLVYSDETRGGAIYFEGVHITAPSNEGALAQVNNYMEHDRKITRTFVNVLVGHLTDEEVIQEILD